MSNTTAGIYSRAITRIATIGVTEEELLEKFPFLNEYKDGDGELDIMELDDLSRFLMLSFEFMLTGERGEFEAQMSPCSFR